MAHPISSDVAWRYGNFLLRQKDYSESFAELRRALMTDPNLTVEAISECSKTSDDLPRILTEVLPNQSRYYLMALDYFLAQHQTDDALSCVGSIAGPETNYQDGGDCAAHKRIDRSGARGGCAGVWRQALEATDWPQNEAAQFFAGFQRRI